MESETLRKIRCIADYQFTRGAGRVLFPKAVSIRYSKKTGRVREVYYKKKLLATLRPTYGTFSLTPEGFKRLVKGFKSPNFRVAVQNDVADIIRKGGTVFAKHVKKADDKIRPEDEVVVTDENDKILAVGKALLSGREMSAFKRGVAVKVRHGVET